MPSGQVTLTHQALDVLTPEQVSSLVRLSTPETVDYIIVQKGGFDLPEGYLAFAVHYKEHNTPMYGGISPEGDVST